MHKCCFLECLLSKANLTGAQAEAQEGIVGKYISPGLNL